MAYADFRRGDAQRRAVYDLFFRQCPCGSRYAVAAGLEQALEQLEQLAFSPDDLTYLESLGFSNPAFLDALSRWRFRGRLRAVPEGTLVFPREPLLEVEGSLLEVRLIGSALTSRIGYQTLIATKASRLVRAARFPDRPALPVYEFGLRRAFGEEAALLGSRAAWIAGCAGTSNLQAGARFGIPVAGTMAHEWVQSFPREEEAFAAFAREYGSASVFLVDTYHPLAGVENTIRVARQGMVPAAIRIDSGDLAYLSRQARRMLDEAGFPGVRIIVSGDLDEAVLQNLALQEAAIDAFGVGTSLITATGCEGFGMVYKMVAVEEGGRMTPTIKVSGNPDKITLPGAKQVTRIYDPEGMAHGDLLHLADEPLAFERPLTLVDPDHSYKRKTFHTFAARDLLLPVLENGEPVGKHPSLAEIRRRREEEEATFPPEFHRLLNPHRYHVDLSPGLSLLRQSLLHAALERGT